MGSFGCLIYCMQVPCYTPVPCHTPVCMHVCGRYALHMGHGMHVLDMHTLHGMHVLDMHTLHGMHVLDMHTLHGMHVLDMHTLHVSCLTLAVIQSAFVVTGALHNNIDIL